MSIGIGAYDPSARYAGTSPSMTMGRKAQPAYLPCRARQLT
jgi:hypothetical protein